MNFETMMQSNSYRHYKISLINHRTYLIYSIKIEKFNYPFTQVVLQDSDHGLTIQSHKHSLRKLVISKDFNR